MTTWLRWCVLIAIVLTPMFAQEDAHQEDRVALRKILSDVQNAINAQDIEGILAQMDPNCTVVWWNAEVSRGYDEIRAYYKRMVKDDGRLINKYTTQAKVDAPARFLGPDVAIADGSMQDEFFPVVRGSFQLSSRWTATVAKTNGDWKIVSLHMSSNVFTNSLMDELKRVLWYVGIVGLVVGGLAGWFLRRRRA